MSERLDGDALPARPNRLRYWLIGLAVMLIGFWLGPAARRHAGWASAVAAGLIAGLVAARLR